MGKYMGVWGCLRWGWEERKSGRLDFGVVD